MHPTGKTIAAPKTTRIRFNFRLAGIAVAVLLSAFIWLAHPFSGLTFQGNGLIAVTITGLAFWIFRPPTMPYLLGGAILLAGGMLLKLPLHVVAAGYSSSAVWVLIPALYFGFALVKTGLGKRIAYWVLQIFEPGYLSICISWFVIGVLLSALTPSITVRLAIVMPIAMSLVEVCRLPDKSNGAALICFVAYAAAVLPGTGWQTGSLWGIILMGFYPPELQPLVTADVWFKYMAFPWFLITLLYLVLLYVAFRPAKALALKQAVFRKHYAALGRFSRDEALCAAILVMALVLFSTEKWTGIPAPAAALMALVALMLVGIIELADIGTAVNWDIIHFFGVVIGLSVMFNAAGVSDWAKPILAPAILYLADSPLILLLALTIILWLIRFVDVAWGFTTLALLAPLLIPLHQQFDLHPALLSVAFIAAGNSFFLAYQQPFIITAESMMQTRGWSSRQVSKAGILFAISALMGIAASTIYWRAMGLMPG